MVVHLKTAGEEIFMARPIEATPVLKGKDARAFLAATKMSAPVSEDRKQWLTKLANDSRKADGK